MKLIIAILPDSDSDAVSRALTDADFRITRIASTGGFLRRGNTTFLAGVEEEQVEKALQLIRDSCTSPVETGHHRGTIFVLNVNRYIHF
mgnify:FL=1